LGAGNFGEISDLKVVVLARSELVAIAQQRFDRGLGARRVGVRDRGNEDGALQVLADAALDLLGEGALRHEGGVVVVLAHGRLALLGGDSDDVERDLTDAHDLAHGVGARTEQLIDDGLAEHDDFGARVDVTLRDG
jgi:hypothetical protein